MTTQTFAARRRRASIATLFLAASFLVVGPLAALDGDSMPIRYRCSGNEPFWNLHLDGRDATFSRLGVDGEESQEIQGHFRLLDYAGVFAWRGPVEQGDAVVFVARQVCLDTMAEAEEGGGARDYGIGISLPGGEVLLGCCDGEAIPSEASPEDEGGDPP